MHALVFFPGDKKTSVIDEKIICLPANKKKPEQGDFVNVKYGNREYRGKIVQFGTQEFLKKLNVNKCTGEVLVPPERALKRRIGANGVKTREICKDIRNSEKAKQKTQQRFDQSLLKSMNKTLQMKNRKSSADVSGNLSDSDEEESEKGKITLDSEAPEEKRTSHMKIPDDAHNENKNCMICDSCAALPVTPEVIIVVEHLLGHLKFQLSLRSARKDNKSEHTEIQGAHQSWKIPGPRKIELMPYTGVWVDSAQIGNITTLHKKDGKELTRQILKWQLGEKKLAGMCAQGGSSVNVGLDPILFQAVKDYVTQKVQEKVDFTRVVNNMCGSLRDKTKKGKGQNQQDKGVSKAKKPIKSKAIVLSSDDSGLSIVPESRVSNAEETTNNIRGTKNISAPRKGRRIRTRRSNDEKNSDSELERCSLWVNNMTGTNGSPSKSERNQDDWEYPSFHGNNSFTTKSGNFSIDFTLDENCLNEKPKTSTPTEGKKRKQQNDEKFILGRRSSSSSAHTLDNISPINPKKLKLHDKTPVQSRTVPESKSPAKSTGVTPKKQLSSKNLNSKNEVTTNVSVISKTTADTKENNPLSTLSQDAMNNGNKGNITFPQGFPPFLTPQNNFTMNFDYQQYWNQQNAFPYQQGIPQQSQFYPYHNPAANVHSTEHFQTETYGNQTNQERHGQDSAIYNNPFSYQHL